MSDDGCHDCRFWRKGAEDAGRCRRNPPAMPDHRDECGVWPLTFDDDWCGEYNYRGLLR